MADKCTYDAEAGLDNGRKLETIKERESRLRGGLIIQTREIRVIAIVTSVMSSMRACSLDYEAH